MKLLRTGAIVAVLALIVAVPAQAKERVFSPVAHEGQEVRFSDGRGVLITGNGLGNLGASFIPLDKKWGYLRVWVENASDQQFNIAESSFTASAEGVPLQVMTYADQVKAQKRKEMWAAILTGVAAGANSYAASQAGYSNYSGSYSAHAYAGGSSASAYGSYSGRSYNGGIAYLAQANAAGQNQAMFDRFSAMSAQASRTLQIRSLKANTLMPAMSVLGDIRLALPKGPDMVVRVDLAGQPIEISFHEGAPVIDSTPHPVTSNIQAPMQNQPYSVPPVGPQSAPAQLQSMPRPALSAAAQANAYAHPSGPAARKELIRLGCDQDFNLVSAAAGRAVFEATCGTGKRQLMECYGSGCRPLN